MKTLPLYPRPQALARTLDELPQIAAVLPAARRTRLQGSGTSNLIDVIPERLRTRIASVSIEDGCLRVIVKSHEAAHATRLERPHILAAARARSLKCSEVRVQVQTRTRPSASPRLRPSAQTIHQLKTTAALIKSERLQTAIARLVETLEQRR